MPNPAALAKTGWNLLKHPFQFIKIHGPLSAFTTLLTSPAMTFAGEIMQMMYLSGIESKVDEVKDQLADMNTNSRDTYARYNKVKMDTARDLEELSREKYELEKERTLRGAKGTQFNKTEPPARPQVQPSPISMTPEDMSKVSAGDATAEVILSKYAMLNEVNDLKSEMRNSFEQSNQVMSQVGYSISNSGEQLGDKLDEVNNKLDDIRYDNINIRESLARMPQERLEDEMAQKMSPEEAKKKKGKSFILDTAEFLLKLGILGMLGAALGKSVVERIKKAFGFGDYDEETKSIDRSEQEQLGQFTQGFFGDKKIDDLANTQLATSFKNKAKYRFEGNTVLNVLEGQKLSKEHIEAIKANREVLARKKAEGTATKQDLKSIDYIDENIDKWMQEAEESSKGIPFKDLDAAIIKIFYSSFITNDMKDLADSAPYLAYINALRLAAYFDKEAKLSDKVGAAKNKSYNKLAEYIKEINRVYIPSFMYRKGAKPLGEAPSAALWCFESAENISSWLSLVGVGFVTDAALLYTDKVMKIKTALKQISGFSGVIYSYPSSVLTQNNDFVTLLARLRDKLGVKGSSGEVNDVSLNKIFENNNVKFLVDESNELTKAKQHTYPIDEFFDLINNYLYISVEVYNEIYGYYLALYQRIIKMLKDKESDPSKDINKLRSEYKLNNLNVVKSLATKIKLSDTDLADLQKIAEGNDPEKAEKLKQLWNKKLSGKNYYDKNTGKGNFTGHYSDLRTEDNGLNWIQYDAFDKGLTSEFNPLDDDMNPFTLDGSGREFSDSKSVGVLNRGPVHMGELTPEVLMRAAEEMGLSSKDVRLTSGYRGPDSSYTKDNPTSAHTTGNAIDVSVTDLTKARLGITEEPTHEQNLETAKLYFKALQKVAPGLFKGGNFNWDKPEWDGTSAYIGSNDPKYSKYYGLFHKLKGGADHFHFQNNIPYLENFSVRPGTGDQLDSSTGYTARQKSGLILKAMKDGIVTPNSMGKSEEEFSKYKAKLWENYSKATQSGKSEFNTLELGDDPGKPDIDLDPLKKGMVNNLIASKLINDNVNDVAQLLATKIDILSASIDSLHAASKPQETAAARSFRMSHGTNRSGV